MLDTPAWDTLLGSVCLLLVSAITVMLDITRYVLAVFSTAGVTPFLQQLSTILMGTSAFAGLVALVAGCQLSSLAQASALAAYTQMQ